MKNPPLLNNELAMIKYSFCWISQYTKNLPGRPKRLKKKAMHRACDEWTSFPVFFFIYLNITLKTMLI